MRICIDSSVFIPGIRTDSSPEARLLSFVSPEVSLVIPRLVALEVTRNLKTTEQVRRFYALFRSVDFAFIVDEPVPRGLVMKYTQLGLPSKADAFIGAFAEWMQAGYLVSENRHFLRQLRTEAFRIVNASEFIRELEAGRL